ncbi:hypothetical protein CERZMDRAFT_87746 [Cercospora zeae-maydis SCOH1-5]|uniref:Myb-like domain-containing protein n=1 Tax=Cercospora zeae-maydis SCOH1-5 TaxID=717836 RepID=A0A6A6F3N1_9PEZI|nr:hypothetical protein CERZMDRAFT_87746 [Cercospora zeae-maydis SCOH1-5]
MPRSGVNWDDASRQQLLLVVYHLSGAPTLKWDQVATVLNNGCTGEAARQQFKGMYGKAKKEFGEAGGVEDGDESKPKAAAKGKGRAKKEAGEAKTTAGAKRKVTEDTVEEDDEEQKPSKRVKQEEQI